MENELLTLVVTAGAIAPVTTGIVEVFKKNSTVNGLSLIGLALFIAMGLLGLVAYVFNYPMLESLLLGLITGFASVGAFEGIQKTDEKIHE